MLRLFLAASLFLAATLPGLAGADELTAIVQKDLTTLGYETGGTDGELTVQTAVAVSRFQAENGMEVTGEITPQLSGVIKAAISKPGQAVAAPAAAPAMSAAATAQAAQMQGAAGMNPAAMQGMMQAGMDPAAMQAMMAAMQDGAPAMDPAALQAMQAQGEAAQVQAAPAQTPQQICLQQKIAAAQQAQQEQSESAQRRRGFGSLMRGISRLGGGEVVSSIAGVTSEISETTAAIGDLESAARDLGLTEDDVASCQNAQ
jgi:peptidoglycan hydrolase-like protein with peptidoglycan-binding domain